MTLRKITVDNSVKNIAQNEQPRFKSNMGKDRKRDKESSQNDKKMIDDVIRGEGFRILK